MLLAMATLFFAKYSPVIADRMRSSVPAEQQLYPEGFWITANLLNVEWKTSCYIIAFCNKPEVKMIKTNTVNGERSSFSWQLDQNLEQADF